MTRSPSKRATLDDLQEKLNQWGETQKRVVKINRSRDQKLQPLLEEFDRKAEEINTAADARLEPLLAEMEALELEIRSTMLREVKPDGTSPISQVDAETAVAVLTIERRREIDPAAFMRAVPPKLRRDPGFLGCLSVLIGKAEKFLDKQTLARLVHLKLSPSVALTLKDE